ncbi:MAG: DUF1501 domain-containing protein [Pirellula sp.]|jgi:hypothetical protein|nr:DUF1501 domain-containing protein [Pirellula sp.]
MSCKLRLKSEFGTPQEHFAPVWYDRSASRALVLDLKKRRLLEDTLVVWGGEIGHTVYCQRKLTADEYDRVHHPRCFTSGWPGPA